MKLPTHHPYTLASRTSQHADQNLPKSMAVSSHGLTEEIKHGHTTKCINHWAESAGFKGVTLNQLCSGLTGMCFEMPNASYTNRCAAYKENPRANRHIWFLPTRKANAEKPKEPVL